MAVKLTKYQDQSTVKKSVLLRHPYLPITSVRRGKIVASLVWLHSRYFYFHTKQLEDLKTHGLTKQRIALLQLDPLEFPFANRWNLKISKLFRALRAPYARCMKRCFVIAHLMPCTEKLDLVIGVLPDNVNEGHAWLELDGQVVADRFNSVADPYKEILRISIHK